MENFSKSQKKVNGSIKVGPKISIDIYKLMIEIAQDSETDKGLKALIKLESILQGLGVLERSKDE